MIRFSANLGYLWKDLPIPDAIFAAKDAGFSAVECHFPYETPPNEIRTALYQTGLEMLSINSSPGQKTGGNIGLASIPGLETKARQSIRQAVTYAGEIHARYVHVLAGVTDDTRSEQVFAENITFACEMATEKSLGILIEPLNRFDAPGYFLGAFDQARRIIDDLSLPNLKLMFDCYHAGRNGHDVVRELERHLPVIGHVQFAGVPDRGEPDRGAVDYKLVFEFLDHAGWSQPLGAEYTPHDAATPDLGWMKTLGH